MDTFLACVLIVILLCLIIPPIIIIGIRILGGYVDWLWDKFNL